MPIQTHNLILHPTLLFTIPIPLTLVLLLLLINNIINITMQDSTRMRNPNTDHLGPQVPVHLLLRLLNLRLTILPPAVQLPINLDSTVVIPTSLDLDRTVLKLRRYPCLVVLVGPPTMNITGQSSAGVPATRGDLPCKPADHFGDLRVHTPAGEVLVGADGAGKVAAGLDDVGVVFECIRDTGLAVGAGAPAAQLAGGGRGVEERASVVGAGRDVLGVVECVGRVVDVGVGGVFVVFVADDVLEVQSPVSVIAERIWDVAHFSAVTPAH